MDSNWEESRALLGDRNHALGFSATSTTTSTPIYVGGTSSRESIFRLPNFQTVQPSICTDHNLQSGDVPVYRDQTQTSFSCGDSVTRNCTIAQSGMTYQKPEIGDFTCIGSPPSRNMGIRKEALRLNVDTVPSVSTAARCSVKHIEVRGNLPSLYETQSSFGNDGAQRILGNKDKFIGAPSTKGIKPGTYDGTGNWSDYLIQFNLIADYWQWNAYEKALHLAINLRGTAQSVLADLRQDQRTNFCSLSSALAARFEPVQQSELHRVTLKTRLRCENETLSELAQDVNRLVRLAYPSATVDVREQLSKDYFIDALNDHELEWAVLRGRPESVDNALKLALEYESFLIGRRDKHVSSQRFNRQSPVHSQGSTLGPSLLTHENHESNDHVPVQSYRRVSTRSQTQSSTDMRQWLEAKSTDDILREQTQDSKISTVLSWKNASAERPKWELVSHLDADCKTYWSQWNRLVVKNGILYRRWICETTGSDLFELVVPETWRNDIVKMFHADPGAGHMGVKRTVERIRSRAYWPRVTETVKRFCERCEQCQKKKTPAKSPKAPIKTNVSGTPNERVQIDILGPLVESYKSNKYIIVLTDCFTKWASAYAVPRATATEVADAILDWTAQFGVMKILHSDQGRQMESAIVKEVCQRFGIHKTRTTSYYPASDGQVERMNRTLIDMLSKYVGQNQRSWDEHIPLALLAYRSSVHESTALSPAMMTYGRELDLPADLIYGSPDVSSSQACEPPAYVAKLCDRMEKIHKLARDKLIESNERHKRAYDLKQFQNNYKVGDQVLLFMPAVKKGKNKKLSSRWTGPYRIVEVLSDVVFRIRLNNQAKDNVVHHNRLKPYHN